MKKLILKFSLVVCASAFADEATVNNTAVNIEVKPSYGSTLAKSETEIPVHLEAAKKTGEAESPWMRLLAGLAVVALMAVGSIIYVKKIKKGKSSFEQAPDIKVLTQHYLGPKKSLAIIRVAGESILIGVTEQNISLIKELSLLDEDIPSDVPKKFVLKESSLNADFDSEPTSMNSKNNEDEEFSISGIKDVVSSKLKNMRTIQ